MFFWEKSYKMAASSTYVCGVVRWMRHEHTNATVRPFGRSRRRRAIAQFKENELNCQNGGPFDQDRKIK